MASQSADTGSDRNQVHPLRSPVPSIRGKANRHHSTRVLGSHFVLDDGRSRKQAARFQDLLQQPSHACLTRGANAGYNRVTTRSQSRLVSLATTLSSPIPNTSRRLTFQRLSLAAVSGQRRHKHPMKSYGVCVLSCSAFRGPDRFAATVSIRQRQDQRSCSLAAYSSRWALSASSARSLRNAKNSFDWPMKSPLAVRNLAASIAAPFVWVGRTIEHVGNCRLRNTVGSGMIRLVWKSSPPKGAALRFGNTSVGSLGSVKAGALPALSCHV